MRRLAQEGLQITLALSLHAPTEELRRELIPWADRVSIDELVSACKFYFDSTGREVTLEYILLGGVNDRPDHARQLATLAKRIRCNVNLIPYNPVRSLTYRRPLDAVMRDLDQVSPSPNVDAGVLTPALLLTMLDRIDRGEVGFRDLIAWAKEIELTEDIAYDPDCEKDIAGLIFEMATPEIDNRSEDRRRADWRRRLAT